MLFEQRCQSAAKLVVGALLLHTGTGYGSSQRSGAVYGWESNPESTFEPRFVRSRRRRLAIPKRAPAAYPTHPDTRTVPLAAPHQLRQGNTAVRPTPMLEHEEGSRKQGQIRTDEFGDGHRGTHPKSQAFSNADVLPPTLAPAAAPTAPPLSVHGRKGLDYIYQVDYSPPPLQPLDPPTVWTLPQPAKDDGFTDWAKLWIMDLPLVQLNDLCLDFDAYCDDLEAEYEAHDDAHSFDIYPMLFGDPQMPRKFEELDTCYDVAFHCENVDGDYPVRNPRSASSLAEYVHILPPIPHRPLDRRSLYRGLTS